MSVLSNDQPIASVLLEDLAASPTPYHAVQQAQEHLVSAGFRAVGHGSVFPSESGSFFVAVGGALVAWVQSASESPPAEGLRTGFTIVGTHTDSPNLRVRTNPDVTSAGWDQVGVETYGGLLLNSWLDRDLGLAGRVSVLIDGHVREILIRDDRPLLRIPQLAIHLDREIRDTGLKLNPQTQMTPLWSVHDDDSESSSSFSTYVAGLAGVAVEQIMSWDLMAFDTQAPALVGRNGDMIASARIDNLFSTFCAVHALIAARASSGPAVPVLALYDHEEVGSESATGASGAFLGSILERVSAALGRSRSEFLADLANSFVVSADGAHATHPNYVDKHDPNHRIVMNSGVVVKRNASQRYASDATSEARFRAVCATAGIPVQTYIHRNDLPCGSTIGPITSGELAISTVDIGAPQLAMHSIRELAGVADADYLADALLAIWQSK